MQIAIPAECTAGETRVAATPETVKKLVAMGHTVLIEQGAGLLSAAPDSAYSAAGLRLLIVDNRRWRKVISYLRCDPPRLMRSQR